MAVSFRYGANGSYKSACAVWFDLLPNLRAGRVCITNVEGMQPLDVIQKRLGEKFPDSTKLIRISSRNLKGVYLWQNWFSWVPIGSFLLIDECQDLFGKHVGFKMEKQQLKPFSEFEDDLPTGFREFFYSKWQPVDLSQVDDGELDDTGRTQYDDEGRILYPFEFNGAFMRHRKYNWDIVMLTPDFKQIPSEVKGCAEIALQHKNTDMALRKRKPRVFEHHPTVTTTKPASGDLVYYPKVPVAVHLLYSSTGTGKQTKSGQSLALFKQPKLLIAMLITILSFGYFIYALSSFFVDDVDTVTEINEAGEVTKIQDNALSVSGETKAAHIKSAQSGGKLVDSDHVGSGSKVRTNVDFKLGGISDFFPFNGVNSVYVSGVNQIVNDGKKTEDVLFKVISDEGVFYINSFSLALQGVNNMVLDDCLVMIFTDAKIHYLTCQPYDDFKIASNENDSSVGKPNVSIF